MAKPIPLEQPMTLKQILRFWAKVEKNANGHGCWLWHGSTDPRGSGHVTINGRTISARRVAWDLEHPTHDPLSPGVKAFAKCGHKNCVNPAHTEIRIGGGRLPQERCARGHEFTEENIYITSQGKRTCRKCMNLTMRRRRRRYRQEGRGWGRLYTPIGK